MSHDEEHTVNEKLSFVALAAVIIFTAWGVYVKQHSDLPSHEEGETAVMEESESSEMMENDDEKEAPKDEKTETKEDTSHSKK